MSVQVIKVEPRKRAILKRHVKNALYGSSLGLAGAGTAKLMGGEISPATIALVGGVSGIAGLISSLVSIPRQAEGDIILKKASDELISHVKKALMERLNDH